jgi:hypothetical protein
VIVATGAAQLVTPEPFVVRTWLAVPAVVGSVSVQAADALFEEIIVVEFADVFARTSEPWSEEAVPIVRVDVPFVLIAVASANTPPVS